MKTVLNIGRSYNFLLFLFLSLTIVLPSTLPILVPNKIWTDIQPSILFPIMDDANHYFTRVSTILSGNLMISNPYFYDTLVGGGYTFVGEYWVAFLSLTFGSIKFGYFLQVTFFTSMMFYTIQKILKFFIIRANLWAFIFIGITFVIHPIWYLRPVAPSTAITLYLLVLISSLKLLNDPTRVNHWPLGSICIILLWFTQPVVAVIASLCWVYTIFICIRSSTELKTNRKFLILLSLFFAPITWYITMNYPYHLIKQETAIRSGLIDSRMPGGLKELIFSFIVIIVLSFIYWSLNNKNVNVIHLFLNLFFANLGGNHQILSGKHAFNSAYSRPIIYIVSILLVVIFLAYTIENIKNSQITAFILILITFFGTILNSYKDLTYLKERRPISLEVDHLYLLDLSKFNILHENKVISAPISISSLLPLYTKYKALYAKEGSIMYPVSNNEILERALLNSYILNDPKFIKEDVEWLFDGYFNNIRARYAWDRKYHRVFVQNKLDELHDKAIHVQKKISENPIYYIKKYRVSGVIYPFGTSLHNMSNLCTGLTAGTVYNFCKFNENSYS